MPLADELSQVPLFSSLSQRQLRRLSRDFKERTFRPGAVIVRQGHMSGVDFFVILEGEVAVAQNGEEVARLGPGKHFGELALIGSRERNSTVTAVGPVRCAAMASWYFRRFVNANPDVSWKLLQHLVNLLSATPAPTRARG
ncbi:MAG TPA: cyclic nucleotide-binding domain-containing protein [Gaiellaceae bacterium]|nr:cyclic nucleotide-binding domain-containing protein [Gaiellaceae bacterium]